MSNTNRDYLIICDVKDSKLTISRPINFYITDKNTSNIFVKLVTKITNDYSVTEYVDIENASSYAVSMRVIKPNNEVKSIEATKLEDEAIYLVDLPDDYKDIPGHYKCELLISTNVNDRQELNTSDKFIYEVKRSILSNVGDIVETVDITTEQLLNELEATKVDLSSQIKDIVNLSLTKHTDGKVYIKKQDGTLIGDGLEIGGSDIDLSKISMSMDNQTLKLMNDGTQIATVEIPTAVVTDEQLTGIIQSKIDDGTLNSMIIQDKSVTPNKTNFFSEDKILLQDITFTSVYASTPGFFGGKGSCGTQLLDIRDVDKIYTRSKTGMPLVWIRYALNNDTSNLTYVSIDGDNYGDMPSKMVEYNYFWEARGIDNHATYPCFAELDLTYWKSIGVTHMSLGFGRTDGSMILVNGEDVKISFTSGDIADCGLSDTMFQVTDKYKDKIHINETTIEDLATCPRPRIVDKRKTITTGYNTALANLFGRNNLILYYGFIDVRVRKNVYVKHFCSNAAQTKYSGTVFACFDENKEFLYLSNSDTAKTAGVSTHDVGNILNNQGLETLPDGTVVYNKGIGYITFPDAVKYAVATAWNEGGNTIIQGDTFVFSLDEITDYNIKDNDIVVKEDFKKAVQDVVGNTDKVVTKGVFIGDSLTNWGGGDDTTGFLGIVHNKTGMVTSNRGLAGATWQTGEGQTQSGVTRVDTIVSDGVKFDLYCFILGTNGGSETDTGETSSDKSTMCGAIRYCLETLKKFDPTGQILVCLPPQRAEGNEHQELVNNVIKTIANSYSVRTLDIYHESGIVPNTKIADIGYLSDGLHLGENGEVALGNLLASEIKYMLCL